MTLVLAWLLLAALGGSHGQEPQPDNETITDIGEVIGDVLEELLTVEDCYTHEEIVASATIALEFEDLHEYFWCRDRKHKCRKQGGYCVPDWWWIEVVQSRPDWPITCEILLEKPCRPNKECQCCIACSENRCSECQADPFTHCSPTNGCNYTEFEVDKKCHSRHCSCCQPCQLDSLCRDLAGYCVNDPVFCVTPEISETPYYASECGCKGPDCLCCRPAGPCEILPEYEKLGGYCTMNDTCNLGFYLSLTGCDGPGCKCCLLI